MVNSLSNRVMSLAEAAQLVKSGDVLGIGGVTMYRRPVAFIRALLERATRPTNLTLFSFTAGYESDLLIGAGMIAQTRTCYFGLEAFGFAPMFTQAANRGEVRIIEETEASLALGIRAELGGVGFMPAKAWLGTDLLQLRPDVKTIVDPYTNDTLVAFPALRCNVAVIHALVADQRGNAILNDNLGIDPELAMVADTVIITAEEVVEKITDKVHIPALVTSAVVHTPQGAYPTSCYPHYSIGGGEILRYIDACNAEDFAGYLDSILSRNV